MIKFKKFKLPEGTILNYDNLYVIPTDMREEWIIYYGDTQYNFHISELDEIYEKINSIGCTSFQISKEELLEIIKKLRCDS